jgi:hypothetical protein
MKFTILKLTSNRGCLVRAEGLPRHSNIVCLHNPPTGLGFTSRCLEEALLNLAEWAVPFEEAKAWVEEYQRNTPENQIEEEIVV